jgi:hypothetical protein
MRVFCAPLIVLTLLTCKGGAGAGDNETAQKRVRAPSNVAWTHAEARDSAASYLVRHLNTKGRFDYLRGSRSNSKKYNLLRHAGAIYSLLQYNEAHPSPELRGAILRASAYLRARYLGPVKGHPDLLALFSKAEEEGVADRTAKLGGAGLGLIALCGSHKLDPSTVSLEDLQGLGRFVLFMQREDGSFHSKYIEESGYDPEFESLYYPGEAMLGLTKLYEVDKDPKWLAAALRAAERLVTSREGVARPPADHWMMIAGSPLLRLHDKVASPAIKQAPLRSHLGLLGGIMMRDQRKVARTEPDSEHGGFNRDGRSTPTATRLEGLVSLLRIQRMAEQEEEGLAESIKEGLAFLQRCQFKEAGANRGGMPRSCAQDAGEGKRDLEIRIDYVQHYLSALLSAEELGLL